MTSRPNLLRVSSGSNADGIFLYNFVEMKCPRCVQNIHRRAIQCPHCGFALADLDDLYGTDEVRLRRLSDMAGALRLKERQKLEQIMDRFEQTFPQLFFSVYYGALEEVASARQFGMWLLNHAAYEDVDISRPNDGGILLVVDLNKKMASITYGYMLDPFLNEDETFHILAKAHPDLLQGNHLKAVSVIVGQLARILKKKSRQARRHPELFDPNYKRGETSIHSLERIRSDRQGDSEPNSQAMHSKNQDREESGK